jgi:sortase A
MTVEGRRGVLTGPRLGGMAGTLNRWSRRLGLALMVAGGLTIVWGIVVWQWEDPFTAVYTMYEQHEMTSAYDARAREFTIAPMLRSEAAGRVAVSDARASRPARATLIAAEQQAIRREAHTYRLDSHEGQPIGRIIVPRLGLNMLFVDGTDDSSLQRGPGRDLQTFMPGENRLVYIAGHRTTFLAPFSHIDALRAGDTITLEMPYATFVYRVTRHIIVPANDLDVLRSGSHELLALQACHPRFFATHRYIVYAQPVKVIATLKYGLAYTPG